MGNHREMTAARKHEKMTKWDDRKLGNGGGGGARDDKAFHHKQEI